jgi:protein ImuB
MVAHRLASGEDDHPPDLREPAPELAVTWLFEPPAETSERTAYAARVLADELHHKLLSRGVACTRIAIEAETETGEQRLRLWRHQGALSAGAIADRARWQLDSWIQSGSGRGGVGSADASRPRSGVIRLTLIPDEVVPATGRQLGLWGSRNEHSGDVTRVVARLQTLLGPDSVTVPEFRGGLGPGERIRLVPAAAVDLAEERPAASPQAVEAPWPGGLPAPSPSKVLVDPTPVVVLDREAEGVRVDGRGQLSGPPVWVDGGADRASGTQPLRRRVLQWAGPWTAEQRWWDPLTSRRRARLQVVLDDGTAHLLSLERGRWSIEATYD